MVYIMSDSFFIKRKVTFSKGGKKLGRGKKAGCPDEEYYQDVWQ